MAAGGGGTITLALIFLALAMGIAALPDAEAHPEYPPALLRDVECDALAPHIDHAELWLEYCAELAAANADEYEARANDFLITLYAILAGCIIIAVVSITFVYIGRAWK